MHTCQCPHCHVGHTHVNLTVPSRASRKSFRTSALSVETDLSMKVRSRHLNVILFADTQRAQAEGLCRISAALNGSAAVHPLLCWLGSARSQQVPRDMGRRRRSSPRQKSSHARNRLPCRATAAHNAPPATDVAAVVCRAACALAGACCALTNGGGPPGGPHPRSDPHDRCHMRRSGAHVTPHAARGHDAAVLSPSSPILPAFWSRALLTPLKRDFAGNILFFPSSFSRAIVRLRNGCSATPSLRGRPSRLPRPVQRRLRQVPDMAHMACVSVLDVSPLAA